MCPSLIEIGSKTAEKNSAQTNRHYKNNGQLAVNQKLTVFAILWILNIPRAVIHNVFNKHVYI